MDSRQRQTIEHRMQQANAVITALAAHGYRAFYSAQYELTGYFYVDSADQGWWVDHNTGMKIGSRHAPMLYQEPERGLLEALLTYIRTGKAIDGDCLKRFRYKAEAFAQVAEAVKELELINDKSS